MEKISATTQKKKKKKKKKKKTNTDIKQRIDSEKIVNSPKIEINSTQLVHTGSVCDNVSLALIKC